jgi:hypothetical protein
MPVSASTVDIMGHSEMADSAFIAAAFVRAKSVIFQWTQEAHGLSGHRFATGDPVAPALNAPAILFRVQLKTAVDGFGEADYY